MPNDDSIDLLETPKNDVADSDQEPGQRDSLSAFFIGVMALFLPVGLLYFNLNTRALGMQIATMGAYTLVIPYILSNRYLSDVPWALLNRFRQRFLALHCIALAVIYGITTLAFAVKPKLPDWFITSGRRGSLFELCLLAIVLILAFWECSLISRRKDEQE